MEYQKPAEATGDILVIKLLIKNYESPKKFTRE